MMLTVKVIVQHLTPKHRIELLKIISLRTMPSMGMCLLVDDDNDIELINNERTKTHITIATPAPDGVDAIIRNTTYFSDIEEDELIVSTQHYINYGWELETDSCGLMKRESIS